MLTVFALLAAVSGAGLKLPADLAAAAQAYDQAQVKGDRAALERLLAADYLLVNSRGKLESRAQLIADYTAPGFRLDPFTVEHEVRRLWGDGAVMGGVATLTGVDGGKPYRVRLRFSDIWAKRGGRWQVIYTAASREPE
ncbi:MAG: nuclear transport factor 2 family protein [Proteobacteria bacterium]|nr:nuclear transport factor 2 family protein [Pseudomonadota bacterium]